MSYRVSERHYRQQGCVPFRTELRMLVTSQFNNWVFFCFVFKAFQICIKAILKDACFEMPTEIGASTLVSGAAQCLCLFVDESERLKPCHCQSACILFSVAVHENDQLSRMWCMRVPWAHDTFLVSSRCFKIKLILGFCSWHINFSEGFCTSILFNNHKH